MPVLAIHRFPDQVLKRPTLPVERLTPAVGKLIDSLTTTMRHHARCVGLAAPQVGSPLRVAVMDSSRNPNTAASSGLLVLVNPVIVDASGDSISREGCLSIPDFTASVRRTTRVRVRAQDRAGRPYEVTLDGFEAIIAQHEIDHLDGRLFLDRVANLATDVFRRKTYL